MQRGGTTDLAREVRRQPEMIIRRPAPSQHELRGPRRAVQSDGHAIAGKGLNDGSLVPEPE